MSAPEAGSCKDQNQLYLKEVIQMLHNASKKNSKQMSCTPVTPAVFLTLFNHFCVSYWHSTSSTGLKKKEVKIKPVYNWGWRVSETLFFSLKIWRTLTDDDYTFHFWRLFSFFRFPPSTCVAKLFVLQSLCSRDPNDSHWSCQTANCWGVMFLPVLLHPDELNPHFLSLNSPFLK